MHFYAPLDIFMWTASFSAILEITIWKRMDLYFSSAVKSPAFRVKTADFQVLRKTLDKLIKWMTGEIRCFYVAPDPNILSFNFFRVFSSLFMIMQCLLHLLICCSHWKHSLYFWSTGIFANSSADFFFFPKKENVRSICLYDLQLGFDSLEVQDPLFPRITQFPTPITNFPLHHQLLFLKSAWAKVFCSFCLYSYRMYSRTIPITPKTRSLSYLQC